MTENKKLIILIAFVLLSIISIGQRKPIPALIVQVNSIDSGYVLIQDTSMKVYRYYDVFIDSSMNNKDRIGIVFPNATLALPNKPIIIFIDRKGEIINYKNVLLALLINQ